MTLDTVLRRGFTADQTSAEIIVLVFNKDSSLAAIIDDDSMQNDQKGALDQHKLEELYAKLMVV